MKKILIALLVAAVAVGAYFLYYAGKGSAPAAQAPAPAGPSQETIAAITQEISGYSYTETYKHAGGDFSFMYPSELKVSSLPSDMGETIVVQKLDKNIGIQIAISPFDGGDIDMTADVIHSSLPDLKITDTQPVEIGNSRKGLAFVSDNAAFGGSSREVWFVYGGNLYQISTYSYLDPLLKGIFATWKFLK